MSRNLSPNHVVWFELGFFPGSVGFCPNEVAWKRVLGKINAPPEPYPNADGCFSWWNTSDGHFTGLITINSRLDGRCRSSAFMGVVAHECTHAFQKLCQDIGEKMPSEEFQAYAIQALVQSTLQAYNDTRRKIWR